ncbi:PREDICTED: sideroflexin-4 [Gekko japonicus]|uniref:Sideroflexin-4 n=1 Tax=Gekko japonicus TaxID=146911 RepID=A0ABM1JLQ5_GEKJA|nr:PREDICTED: sideroflexin-4 [Gekko japonicus]
MDLNLEFWKSEGKTFSQRFHHWIDILDPLLLLKSKKEIEASRTLLLTSGPDIAKSLQNKEIKEAWNLSLASVNPATGDTVLSVFRPPAFLPLTAPLVIGILLPHKGVKQAFHSQVFFHTYISGFSVAHGNFTQDSKEFPYKEVLLSAGAILYSASIAILPHYIMTRYQVRSPSMQLFMKVIPGPLTAALCAFNVVVIRTSETEKGIKIMDSKGRIVGVSKKAGEKGVRETALCRAVVFGTAVCIPDIVLHYLKRTSVFAQSPRLGATLRSIMIISTLGLMIPVSFSWIPQLGTIQRSVIEPEIICSTEETEFFYNRGL